MYVYIFVGNTVSLKSIMSIFVNSLNVTQYFHFCELFRLLLRMYIFVSNILCASSHSVCNTDL